VKSYISENKLETPANLDCRVQWSVYIHLPSIFLLQFLYKPKYYLNIEQSKTFAQFLRGEP